MKRHEKPDIRCVRALNRKLKNLRSKDIFCSAGLPFAQSCLHAVPGKVCVVAALCPGSRRKAFSYLGSHGISSI